MNIDEQFLEMSVKSILIELVNEDVIVLNHLKILKGQFLLPFFLCVILQKYPQKNDKLFKCQKDIVENHLKTQV